MNEKCTFQRIYNGPRELNILTMLMNSDKILRYLKPCHSLLLLKMMRMCLICGDVQREYLFIATNNFFSLSSVSFQHDSLKYNPHKRTRTSAINAFFMGCFFDRDILVGVVFHSSFSPSRLFVYLFIYFVRLCVRIWL